MPRLFRLVALGSLAILIPLSLAHATSAARSQTALSLPVSNVASSGPLLDGSHLVYGVAAPRFHHPTCVSCGDAPFTGFRVQVFVRDYTSHPGGITVSAPRLLFSGPRGAQLIMYSLARGWLVYATSTPDDHWRLLLRNVAGGRATLLDSPGMEGQPSRFLHASSDGRTVVWQSWTAIDGKTTSVIRSYTLATGRRRLLFFGGTGLDYFYGYPQVSGNRVIVVREPGTSQYSQLFMLNLTTDGIHPLTPSGQWNDEPAIAGNIAVWVHGRLTLGSSHGLVVANLATGKRIALKHSSAQLPRIVADRYIVFATDSPRVSVQSYDTLTGRRVVIAPARPGGSGFVPDETVEAGGATMLYQLSSPCSSPTFNCPHRTMLLTLE